MVRITIFRQDGRKETRRKLPTTADFIRNPLVNIIFLPVEAIRCYSLEHVDYRLRLI